MPLFAGNKPRMNADIRRYVFMGFLGILLAAYWSLLRDLIGFALHNDFATHILLIPFISAFLIYRIRPRIKPAPFLGGAVAALGVIATVVGSGLTYKMMAMLLVFYGGFIFCYGLSGFQAASFPLLFLVFMIPIPDALLNSVVTFLQRGSTEGVAILFRLTGTTFYREGYTFMLPGLNITIAPQCSSIRSSLALFITALLAGHLMLKTGWKKALLVLAAIPVAAFKNAVRITVLSLLAIHVDTRILTNSDLHRDGGILFYLLGMAVLAPLLWSLQRSERSNAAPQL